MHNSLTDTEAEGRYIDVLLLEVNPLLSLVDPGELISSVEISVVATSSGALSVMTGAGSILETRGAAFFFAAAFFFGALLRVVVFAAFLTDFAFFPFESLACFPLLLALAFAILIALAKHLFLSLFFFGRPQWQVLLK